MTRETLWSIDADRVGFTAEVPTRAHRAIAPDDLATAYRERALREIVRAVEERGYTTHLDIIRDASDYYIADGAWGDLHRFQFPPDIPKAGDPIRFLNGPLAGDTATAPDSLTYLYGDQTVYTIGDTPIAPGRYDPVAFDTATGHWVYRTFL